MSSIADEIKRWADGRMRLWSFTISHGVLVFQLVRNGPEKTIVSYLIMGACSNFRLTNNIEINKIITIKHEEVRDGDGEMRSVITIDDVLKVHFSGWKIQADHPPLDWRR